MNRLTRAILCLACLGTAVAEVAAQPAVIVRGGVIQSSLGGDDAAGFAGRTGISVGASIHFALAPWVGAELGGMVTQKGFVASGANVERVRLDYFQVPAMLRFATPSAGLFSAHVFGGPALSLKAGCQLQVETAQTTITTGCAGTGITAIKVVDFNVLFGGGIALSFGWQVPIMLDFVYDAGLRNLDADDGASDFRHRSWALLLSTRLSLPM